MGLRVRQQPPLGDHDIEQRHKWIRGFVASLRLSETYDAIEACLNEELEGALREARRQRALDIRRLWGELDDPVVLKSIFSRHRHLYFEWRREAEIDEVGQRVLEGSIEAIDERLCRIVDRAAQFSCKRTDSLKLDGPLPPAQKIDLRTTFDPRH